jgi:hypothetical protein
MSLLTIVQKFTLRRALPKPVTVIGNTDPQVQQILTILEEECIELAARKQWKGLINEATFLSKNQEDQGTLASLGTGPTVTNGLRYLMNSNMWNRSMRLPIFGPVHPVDWQQLKAFVNTGPFYQYRLRGVTTGAQASLLINPIPALGHTIAFEYFSDNWCLSGVTPSNVFVTDNDTLLLPESVVAIGLAWRWKKEKGLGYSEDFQSYERLVADAMGRDGSNKILNMSDAAGTVRPGIWVPAGNWPLP